MVLMLVRDGGLLERWLIQRSTEREGVIREIIIEKGLTEHFVCVSSLLEGYEE